MQAETPNILSCDVFRTFWVMWSTNTVSVGYGGAPKPGTNNQFISYTNPNGTGEYIQAVGIINSAQIIAEYEFVHLTGNLLC